MGLVLFYGMKKGLKCKESSFDADGLEIALFFIGTFAYADFGFLFADKVKTITACFFKNNKPA
jgi:hypothetical protein